MVKCKNCKIEILSQGTECPLCHTPLDIALEDNIAESAFPPREYVKATYVYNLDKYFLPVAVFLSVLFLFVEGFYSNGQIKIAWIPMAVSLDIFYWLRIKHYIQKYLSDSILTHTLGLSLIAISTRFVLPDPKIIFEYIIPAILLLSYLAMTIYALQNIHSPKKYIISSLILALLSSLPLILCFIYEGTRFFLPILLAIIGNLSILAILLFGLARVLWEIKKIFHI